MSLIAYKGMPSYDEDRIELMWKMCRLVREMNDVPMLWKLTEPFLEAVSIFLGLTERKEVLRTRFLDAGIDSTTKEDTLIGGYTHYDFKVFIKKASPPFDGDAPHQTE